MPIPDRKQGSFIWVVAVPAGSEALRDVLSGLPLELAGFIVLFPDGTSFSA